MRLEGLSAIDAFLNAAMLLGGMGPVDAPQTDAGKVFADLSGHYYFEAKTCAPEIAAERAFPAGM